MRTLLYLITLPLATVWFGGICIVAGFFRVKRVPGGVYDRAQRRWARTILAASGVKVTVEGAHNIVPGAPQLLAANHASFFDIMALLGYLPVDPKFVAKKELFSIPVFGWAIKAAGHVRIDRGHLKEAFGAYDVAAKRIREDKLPVLVYPEGTRSKTGELLPFKKGPFVLAIAVGAPVVPIYVRGAFGIQPKGSIKVNPHPMHIIVGEPVPAEGMKPEDRDTLATAVRSRMVALSA